VEKHGRSRQVTNNNMEHPPLYMPDN